MAFRIFYSGNASAHIRCSDTKMPGVIMGLVLVIVKISWHRLLFTALLYLCITFHVFSFSGGAMQRSASLVVFVMAIACT
jgi:hypothetical protein